MVYTLPQSFNGSWRDYNAVNFRLYDYLEEMHRISIGFVCKSLFKICADLDFTITLTSF